MRRQTKECIFRYVYLTEEEKNSRQAIRNATRQMLAELVFLPSDRTRKVSLIFNTEDAYKSALAYRDRISYKGNLSIVFVDDRSAALVAEEFISYYDDKLTDDVIKLI